tara:strand:- start:235 stop:549 length:315 start_codon:yes stop_codon:yes gene_type:complete
MSEQRKETIVDWTIHITWNNGDKEFRADTPYSKVIEEWLDNVQEEEAENDSLIQEDLRENIQNELADMTVNDFTNLIDKHDLGIAELDAMFYDLLEILVKERSK